MKPSYLQKSNSQITNRVGSLDQICSAKKLQFSEGPSKGLTFIEVHTGGGLFFHILADRGMGIGRASISGIPICWISAMEEVSPNFYNPVGEAWLESFGGGLLTSCGLTNVGKAAVVDGVAVGLHGRLSNIPARDVTIQRKWNDDEYSIVVEGTMVDGYVMGPCFSVKRSYEISMGSNNIHLHDEIENIGMKKEPLFHLYHLNFGYPFVSETSNLNIYNSLPNIDVKDESYRNAIKNWDLITEPERQASERVFYHRMDKTESRARVCLSNEYDDMKISADISFPTGSLDHLVEWQMFGERNYVLGLEPGNTFASGRDYSFSRNDVEYLEPGEVKMIDLDMEFRQSAKTL